MMLTTSIRPMRSALLVALGAIVTPSLTHAADPVALCQASKNKAAGAYATCRHKAEAKLATTGAADKYGVAIAKCAAKLTGDWAKFEAKAAQKGATCLDGTSTGPAYQAVIDGVTTNVATGLAGGGLAYCGNGVKDGLESCDGSDLGATSCTSFGFAGGVLACTGCDFDTTACLPIVCGNGAIDAGEQCDQNDLNGATCIGLGFSFGSLACGPGCVLDTSGCWDPPQLTDNGDGTITDHATGLMWEKKADFDGAPVTCTSAGVCPDPHDADNLYFWTDNTVPTTLPTGSAFTVFLAQLNAGGGFAGHTDWRLPTLAELHALVDYGDPTSPFVNAVFDTGCNGSCTVTTCSCTNPSRYWTNTSHAGIAADAWVVDPGNGEIIRDTKDTDYAARAVRSGP